MTTIQTSHINEQIAKITAKKVSGHEKRLSAILYLFTTRKISDEHDAIALARCAFIQYEQDLHPCMARHHETLTVFWAKEVWRFYYKNNIKQNTKLQKRSLEELEELLKTSSLFDKNYIYNFYTKKCIESKKAKALYVPPDNIVG